MTAPDASYIRSTQEGAVGYVRINRPERRNALNSQMYADISSALIAFDENQEVNAIVLSGEGRDFCAGNDISDFRMFGDLVDQETFDPQSIVGRQTPSIDIVYVMMELKKPLAAVVQGNVIGFGATMLLHCDIVVAEDTTKMRYPFVDLALVPEAGSSLLLKERMGFVEANKLLMLGGTVEADAALKHGLVTEVVPAGTGQARISEIANILASKPPQSLQATKRLIRRDPEPLGKRVEAEFSEIAVRTGSPEAQAVFAVMSQGK